MTNKPNMSDDSIQRGRRQRNAFEDPAEFEIGSQGFDPLLTPGDRGLGVRKPTNDTSVDIDACECEFPDITTAGGDIGPYHEEIVYCERCHHRFVSIVKEREDNAE